MANREHLDILNQGVGFWHAWRKRNPNEEPDLSDANLSEVDLSYADLTNTRLVSANLTGADLWSANLSDANLSHAYLWSANLSDTNLSAANFSEADLSGTDIRYANLSNANLTSTYLAGANLSDADLSNADLSNAIIGRTVLGDRDLRVIKGLETIKHEGPSPLSINTIYLSEGDISETFLKGAGVDDTFIEYMRSLVGRPIQYNSCFISHSSNDQEIADRLYADLQSKNVRCWFAPEDMKIGDRIRPRIYEQIHFNDKLLLILSASSVESEWVNYEVETVLARERKEKRDILFPIRIDDAVKESKASWAAHIQATLNIGNFTRWKEHDEYQKKFDKLLGDLKKGSV